MSTEPILTLEFTSDTPATEDDDAALLQRIREGDTSVFSELWERHSVFAQKVARVQTSSFDSDDLVSESFTRIYRILLNGGGPKGDFRPYLYVTIKNLAREWGRSLREFTMPDEEWLESLELEEPGPEALSSDTLLAHAFAELPQRWQEVLYRVEIEGVSPAALAKHLGLTPNTTHQLIRRAREGLREAWVQAHIPLRVAGSECRWATERMGAYERDRLSKRERGRFERHVEDCIECSQLVKLAEQAGSRIRVVLFPILLAGGLEVWRSKQATVASADTGGLVNARRNKHVSRGQTSMLAPGRIAVGALLVCALVILFTALDNASPAGGAAVSQPDPTRETIDGVKAPLVLSTPWSQQAVTAASPRKRLGAVEPGDDQTQEDTASRSAQDSEPDDRETSPDTNITEQTIEQPSYNIEFLPLAWGSRGGEGTNFTELVSLRISNAGEVTPNQPLTLSVSHPIPQHWSISDVLRNGLTDPAISFTHSSGSTFVTIQDPPGAGESTVITFALTYDWSSWSHDFVLNPDFSSSRIDRPGTAITVRVYSDTPEGSNVESTVYLWSHTTGTPAP
ncbi:sigma-70 family RNA polymerase sigma factor [Leucobacter coleopterorum]|uniref:Sigma-70 family RNA polymerase sigma factor n=1 Tax=Leucobacter coleopterorum TaxID=2714933 RepID=A0ABX6JVC4_9MICO|nr:sigma-70 family RNA polymerase sigma factor [Leucobacter coleopterorum]